MQVRIRGKQVYLMVSRYHRYDPITKTGGRNTLETKHKFPANALEIPADIAGQLTDDEIEKVMRVAILPARELERQRLERKQVEQAAAALHDIDPNWRIKGVSEFLCDLQSVYDEQGPELDMAKLAGVVVQCTEIAVRASSISSEVAELSALYLMSLATSISKIAKLVGSDSFPAADKGNVKESPVYKVWMEVGEAKAALQIPLQKKGYVQKREKKD
ncbi:hypothetical protein GTP56_05360 [Duganella sp. FT134W]|uniref:Uncharacterized protein n=1 Tax=Duganella margarita TaxID=2692170 RepID=A0A7X4GZU2_9BURK|nr:hypothetical protein [Duganella margarita]MYM71624.1 hypothetical protein [Duganella margarita]